MSVERGNLRRNTKIKSIFDQYFDWFIATSQDNYVHTKGIKKSGENN
jgi:hypothetical protein